MTSGWRSAMISRVRRSCAGLRNENRSSTAIASTPSATSSSTACTTERLVERDQNLAGGA